MAITCEDDKDIIIYALEKIISYARQHQYMFLAQSVWQISSIIGLQSGLVIHIDNFRVQNNLVTSAETNPEIGIQEISIHPSRGSKINKSDSSINKKHLCQGGMAPSEWTRFVSAVKDTPLADYSTPGVNTTRCVAYRPPIAASSRSVGLLV
jgi:hypothetical protein